MRSHSPLADWEIENKGLVPMDFVCTDRQIFDHLRREEDAGNIVFSSTKPDHFFCKNRGIKNLGTWMAEKTAEFDEDSSWLTASKLSLITDTMLSTIQKETKIHRHKQITHTHTDTAHRPHKQSRKQIHSPTNT